MIADYKRIKSRYEIEVCLSDNLDLDVLDFINVDFENKGEIINTNYSDLIERDYTASTTTTRDYLGTSLYKRTYLEFILNYRNNRVLFGSKTCKILSLTPSISDDILRLTLREF